MNDYICITDMAAAKSENSRAADVVKNWLRNRRTLEFLGTWEPIYNPDFKVVEFDHFKKKRDTNLNFKRVQFEAVRKEAGLIQQEIVEYLVRREFRHTGANNTPRI